MPIRVGIDLTSAESVRESIAAHGSAYLERVYSPREIEDCTPEATVDPERLAARFAAKEAAFKLLRIGDEAVSWRDVEVLRDPSGWVTLRLTGNAARLAGLAQITDLSVSLTHERGCAAAVVIAEIAETADT
jgi:holo-[acyl-carrier protein] synthase